MIKKRGISTVIATVIMIALVILVVGIVWVFIQNIISQEIEAIETGLFRIDLEIKSVKVESDGSIKVRVGRGIGEGGTKQPGRPPSAYPVQRHAETRRHRQGHLAPARRAAP